MEHQLDDHQPEEQHGICHGKRIEKHPPLDHKCFPGSNLTCWYSNVGCKVGFVKGISLCPLASTLEKFA